MYPWYSVISVPDLSAMDLAPAVYWEWWPDLPEKEDSLSNSDLLTPKSTVVSATDLRRHWLRWFGHTAGPYLKSYSVPDLDVL